MEWVKDIFLGFIGLWIVGMIIALLWVLFTQLPSTAKMVIVAVYIVCSVGGLFYSWFLAPKKHYDELDDYQYSSPSGYDRYR